MSLEEEKVKISRGSLQILLHSGRSLYNHILQMADPTMDVAIMVKALNDAIDEGHAAIGTQRAAADQWMLVLGGITQAQLQNLHKMLAEDEKRLASEVQPTESEK